MESISAVTLSVCQLPISLSSDEPQEIMKKPATTAKLIRKAIDNGIKLGETPEQVADRILQTVFDPSVTSVRARMIARTEMFKISNFGVVEGVRAHRTVNNVKWITSRDSKVRPAHVFMESLKTKTLI